jgi:hypothetical protein
VVREVFDDEVVIVNLDSGAYYSLGGTGTQIWNLMEQGLSPAAITDNLVQFYDGSRDEIHAGLEGLLRDLLSEKLIVSFEEAEPDGILPPTTNTAAAVNGKKPFETPVLSKYSDMEDLLLLDPIHDVDETGWPAKPPDTSEA